MRKEVFGLPIKYEVWNKKEDLPLFIADGYDFKSADINGKRCIIIATVYSLPALPELKKQIKRIRKIEDVPVVIELKSISSYRRKSLIEHNIPFITEKQVFLPFIGAVLMEETEAEKTPKKFFYSTQQFFLYYLYGKNKKMYISELGKYLPFSAMTISRAVKQLEASGLFVVAKDGVRKIIESKYSKKDLLRNAMPYLSSPVLKSGYIEKAQLTADMVCAGETLLAEKTMLNPGAVATYAIYEKEFNKVQLVDELVDPEKQVHIELWAYAPSLFSNGDSADFVSVALSFKNNPDERIEEAVEELIKGRLQGEW